VSREAAPAVLRPEVSTLATSIPARDRRARFAQEYLVDLNATQAAVRAGYSPRTAGSQASDLLKKPEIQAAIQVAMNERAQRVGVTADEVLAELKAMVLSRVDHYEVGPDGSLRLREGAPPGAMGAVASFRRRVRRLISGGNGKKQAKAHQQGTDAAQVQEELDDAEVRLWNKVEAARLAMQHLKLVGDREQGGGGVEKVFFLPVVAVSAEEWQRQVAERKALPPAAG